MGFVKGLFVSLLMGLITIAIVDAVAFFILDIKPQGYKPDRYFSFSERYGFYPKSNVEDTWYAYRDGSKFPVATNSEGFTDRSRELAATKPRVALIGDSTTAMWEAEPDKRPQVLMEQTLGGAEVLNFGMRGFGTDQTLLVLQDKVLAYKPDVVVYTFCVNDIANNADRDGKPWFELGPTALSDVQGVPVKQSDKVSQQGLKRSKLEEISFSTRIMRSLYRRFVSKPKPPTLEEHFELRAYRKDYTEVDNERLALTLALINKLKEEVESSGAKFLLVDGYYRPAIGGSRQSQVIKQYGDVFDFKRVGQALATLASDQDMEFLSLGESVDGGDIDRFTHRSDAMHFNNAGSEWFAGVLSAKLKSLGWL